MRNVAYCLESAQTKYVWTIGDDDPVEDEAIRYVINQLKQVSDVSLLILNFSLYDIPTNQVLYKSTFDVENELLPDGQKYLENYLTKEHRGLGFLSSQIYHTESIKQALKSWSGSVNNLEGQIYWGAFCAAIGKVIISKKNYVVNARIPYKPRVRVKMHFVDLPQVFVKLMSIGYCPKIFRQRIINHFGEEGLGRLLKPALQVFPIFTVKYIVPNLVFIASYIVPMKKGI